VDVCSVIIVGAAVIPVAFNTATRHWQEVCGYWSGWDSCAQLIQGICLLSVISLWCEL